MRAAVGEARVPVEYRAVELGAVRVEQPRRLGVGAGRELHVGADHRDRAGRLRGAEVGAHAHLHRVVPAAVPAGTATLNSSVLDSPFASGPNDALAGATFQLSAVAVTLPLAAPSP